MKNYNRPVPAQWAASLHNSTTGVRIDENLRHPTTGQSQLEMLVEKLGTVSDGVPQVAVVFSNELVQSECQTRVNNLARSNPQWATQMGFAGLFRAQAACIYEARGEKCFGDDCWGGYPGFANEVIQELLQQGKPSPLWQRPMVWIGVAAMLGVVALLRR